MQYTACCVQLVGKMRVCTSSLADLIIFRFLHSIKKTETCIKPRNKRCTASTMSIFILPHKKRGNLSYKKPKNVSVLLLTEGMGRLTWNIFLHRTGIEHWIYRVISECSEGDEMSRCGNSLHTAKSSELPPSSPAGRRTKVFRLPAKDFLKERSFKGIHGGRPRFI